MNPSEPSEMHKNVPVVVFQSIPTKVSEIVPSKFLKLFHLKYLKMHHLKHENVSLDVPILNRSSTAPQNVPSEVSPPVDLGSVLPVLKNN